MKNIGWLLFLGLILSSTQAFADEELFESLNSHSAQVVIGNHATEVRDTGGPGEPFILIHALGVDQRMWSDVVIELKKHTG